MLEEGEAMRIYSSMGELVAAMDNLGLAQRGTFLENG